MPNQDNDFIRTNKYDKVFKTFFILILLVGFFLRFYQYLMGRSLWPDECHLALNFIKYGYLRLAKPLDYIQAAPIFWIFSVKTFAEIFGYGECALRATTFIASILTFPLFYYILLELTKNKIAALIGFFIFSLNLSLVYFSSELKPYGVDVSVYLLLVYLAVSQHKFIEKNRHLLLAIAGCLSILFSNVAFLILFCIVCYMVMNWYKEKKVKKEDIQVIIAWAIVFIANYFLFIYKHPSTIYQRDLYSFAFCPTDILSCEFVFFMKQRIEEIFFTMLLYISRRYAFAYVLLFIFIVAARYLITRKKYTIIIFTCLPILLHLGLSALKLYPFWFRLILYLVPCFIILITLGTYLVADFIAKKIHFAFGFIFVIVCCIFFVNKSIIKFPLWPLEIKPAISYLNKNYPNAHLYMINPINAYRYYYLRGFAKDSIYKEIPWAPFSMTPKEYDEFISGEKNNYILFYASDYKDWGYGAIIENLKMRNLITKSYEYKGYIVSEVKPDIGDTVFKTIDYTYFDSKQIIGTNEKIIAIWSKYAVSKPVALHEGKYDITIVSQGTSVGNVFPHNNIFINEDKIGDFTSTRFFGRYTFSFEIKQDTSIIIKIDMDNDASANGEDRNTFIRNIYLLKATK